MKTSQKSGLYVTQEAGNKARDRLYEAKTKLPALLRGEHMTQEQFAARIGFSVATVRHWERGARRPQGPALVST
ncbi:helix-turn-helix domain-containing protein [Azoarcus sp. CIB]|uniref:helix-turn-helix domain-containing protein n=1 Tax=Aromatoleum sp. (strain CIB) TaxID=198107 RepID=UPI001E36432C|nr:helix-turn-helix domain-containing protein [Azoarcus sp. CIB]